MISAHFRFSTEILARLGEELNPSLDQGVIELVKNAHDADAGECIVRLQNVESAGGSLTVHDTGDGMTAAELRDKFLLLGSSSKDRRRTARLRRIPAGSKGLGRLAALRSGDTVLLATRPRSDAEVEHTMLIEWERFSDKDIVDEVELRIDSHPRPAGAGPGTTIEVCNLHRAIGRREAKRLARALLLLADPFGEDPESFRPVLESDEFTDLAELVGAKYFDSAEYHLHASVDPSGQASAKVLDWKGDALFEASHSDLRQDERPYGCPPCEFDFWVFILDAKTFSTRSATLGEVREWLREFGGIMLYINGLRVPPYGDPGSDWLDLNLRRTASPEERPSTQTSIGRIQVNDLSGALEEKTDRGGLIENDAFDELRAMARDSLEWMAKERLRVAEVRRQRDRERAPKQSSNSREKVEAAIAKAGGGSSVEIASAFNSYDEARDREVKVLRDEVQLYRTLSTAGIAAATFAHEASHGPLKVIGRAISAIRRRVERTYDPLPTELAQQIEQVESSAESLGLFGDTTLDLISKDKRRSGRVEVNQVIDRSLKTYLPFLEAREIEASFTPSSGSPYIQGSEAAIESIMVNLIANAMTALSMSEVAHRRVHVETRINDRVVEILVSDNAGGIADLSSHEIWLPGKSSREGGSGLGLTIVRDTAIDLGGRAAVVERDTLGGATFRVTVPILGV